MAFQFAHEVPAEPQDNEDLQRVVRAQRKRYSWKMPLINFGCIVGILFCLVALLLPATRTPRTASQRSQCRNSLKQIGLALINYADDFGQFPPAYTVDSSGNRLHSWRTLILPYLDQQTLYNSIDLSKPWNDPVNQVAATTRLPFYECPTTKLTDGRTPYLACVGPELAFLPETCRKVGDFTDGRSNTVLVMEVNRELAVHWMAPVDLDMATAISLPEIQSQSHKGGFHVLLADDAVQHLPKEIDRAALKALLTVNGADNGVCSAGP